MKDLLAENCCKILKDDVSMDMAHSFERTTDEVTLGIDTLLGWKKVDPFPHLWKPNSMFQNLKVQPILIIHLW